MSQSLTQQVCLFFCIAIVFSVDDTTVSNPCSEHTLRLGAAAALHASSSAAPLPIATIKYVQRQKPQSRCSKPNLVIVHRRHYYFLDGQYYDVGQMNTHCPYCSALRCILVQICKTIGPTKLSLNHY